MKLKVIAESLRLVDGCKSGFLKPVLEGESRWENGEGEFKFNLHPILA